MTRLSDAQAAKRVADVRAFCERVRGIHTLYKDAPSAREVYDTLASRPQQNGGFLNVGYWTPDTGSIEVASRNLMTQLVGRVLPPDGPIVDVGCGLGATTRFLSAHFSDHRVFGVNISARQLSQCGRIAPGCRFLQMDATRMGFADGTFAAMYCVEAALHFQSRQRFLAEAFRLLREGGVLAMTDLLLYREGHSLLPGWMPADNYLDGPDSYRDLLLETGFSQTTVIDITPVGWARYAEFELSAANRAWLRGDISFGELQARTAFIYVGSSIYSHNVMCFAIK